MFKQYNNYKTTVIIIMFSSLTDRFFHGMNKRNTKMVETVNIKTGLNTSRSRRNSQSKSKTTRMFDISNQSSVRNSLNQTLKLPISTDSFSNTTNQFMPPKSTAQPSSYTKRKYFSKTSGSQFAPPSASKDLYALIDKQIANKGKKQNQNQNQNIGQIQKSKEQELLSTLSLKEKLKIKIEQNAIKKYHNFCYLQSNRRIQRVEEQNTIKLLNLMGRSKDEANSSVKQSSMQLKNIEKADKQSFNSKQQNSQQQQMFQQSQINSQDAETIKQSKQVKSNTNQNNYGVTKKQEFQGLNSDIKQPIDADRQKRIFPSNQTSQKTLNPKIQTLFRQQKSVKTIDVRQYSEGSKREAMEIKFEQKGSNQAEPNKKQNKEIINNLKNEGKPQKQLAASQKVINQQKNQEGKQKANSFWNQSNDQFNFLTSLQNNKKTNQEKQKKQLVNVKAQKQQKIKQVKQNIKTKVPERKIEVSEIQDLEQINIGAKKQVPKNEGQKIRPQINQPRQQEKNMQNPKTADKYKKQVVKKQQANKNKQINAKKQQIPFEGGTKSAKEMKNDQKQKSAPFVKQSQKINEANASSNKIKFKKQQVQEQIEYILYLVNQVGHFSKKTKKFYEKNKITIFQNQYQVECFYLWSQLYFLRNRCLSILEAKNKDFYEISKQLLKEPQLQQMITKQIQILQQEQQACVQLLQSFHSAAKKNLPLSEKNLVVQVNEIKDNHKNCLNLLSNQFKQLQKQYKKSIQSNDPNEQKYVSRLCQVLQMYCLLKYLNGEQVKDYYQIQDIQNKDTHYQQNKHLVGV